MNRKVLIYNHGGSGNHGCEALARTVISLLSDTDEIDLLSEEPGQDQHYELTSLCSVMPAKLHSSKKDLSFIKAYASLKIKKDYYEMDFLDYRRAISKLGNYDLAISIGGDVYCYDYYPLYIKIHQLIREHAKKTVLLGCSLEKHLFEDDQFLNDIRTYDLITARESMTYEYLKAAGIHNVELIPDTAFTLPVIDVSLPENFISGNTVGINLSPLVLERDQGKGLLVENYKALIKYVLNETDMNIALIPHVVWTGNDDRKALEMLRDSFKDSDRIVMIDDHNCMELKGFISKCRFFIGARTHATIAAYSSCVPTLVLGYSVKSKGIAKDLFGTDEGYVVHVKELESEHHLADSFMNIVSRESDIRKHLLKTMPDYIKKTERIKEIL